MDELSKESISKLQNILFKPILAKLEITEVLSNEAMLDKMGKELADPEFESDYETPKEHLLEFASGSFKQGSKYIQRLGSPGHYVYVYATDKYARATMKVQMAYKRQMMQASKLFNKLQARFDPRSFSVKPSKNSWNVVLVNMTMRKPGVSMEMMIDLKSTKFLSYRIARKYTGLTGPVSPMSRLKKKGTLKYKGAS